MSEPRAKLGRGAIHTQKSNKMNKLIKYQEEKAKGNVQKLTPVHINKMRCENYFWHWSSNHGDWIRGEEYQKKSKTMTENIKKWYIAYFPTDELGREIDPPATFEGAKDNLSRIYEYLDVYDSVVRERVFDKLSELMGVSYKEIYDQWLNLSNA